MKQCNGNYEGAMNYDCSACDEKECPFRKGSNGTFLVVVVMFVVIMIVFILSKIGVIK